MDEPLVILEEVGVFAQEISAFVVAVVVAVVAVVDQQYEVAQALKWVVKRWYVQQTSELGQLQVVCPSVAVVAELVAAMVLLFSAVLSFPNTFANDFELVAHFLCQYVKQSHLNQVVHHVHDSHIIPKLVQIVLLLLLSNDVLVFLVLYQDLFLMAVGVFVAMALVVAMDIMVAIVVAYLGIDTKAVVAVVVAAAAAAADLVWWFEMEILLVDQKRMQHMQGFDGSVEASP